MDLGLSRGWNPNDLRSGPTATRTGGKPNERQKTTKLIYDMGWLTTLRGNEFNRLCVAPGKNADPVCSMA